MSVTEMSSGHSGHQVTGQPSIAAWPRWLTGGRRVGLATGQRTRRLAAACALPLVDALALATLIIATGATLWFGTVYVVAVVATLGAEGQHRLRICLRVSDQVPRIAVAAALPLALLLPWAHAEGGVVLAAFALGLLVTFRSGACAVLRSAHRRGFLMEPTLVLGAGSLAVRIARLLEEHPEFGLTPKGFLDRRAPEEASPLPVLGDPAEVGEVVRRHRIRRVIVCFPAASEAELVSVLRACRPLAADVCVVPRLYELGMAMPRSGLDEVWGIPLVPLRRYGHAHVSPAKRAFDIVVGGLLILVLAPLLSVLALAVRIGSGRAFFRQLRVTQSGSPTEVVKLRTVIGDAGDSWAVRAHQCTRLGRWLRATHLDELPQLLNVLRGDMSLVGPRPERPYYAMRFAGEIPRYDDRHRMPGGMTGWAQVHGLHGDTSIPDRARFDNQYIEYWSLWLDVVIVARTIAIVLIAAGRSPAASRMSGEDKGEGTACDHRLGRRGRRAATALGTPAHPARLRRGRALQPRRCRPDDLG